MSADGSCDGHKHWEPVVNFLDEFLNNRFVSQVVPQVGSHVLVDDIRRVR